MATGNIIIGPNNNTGLYTGVTSNTSINGGGGNGSGNYSNANVASYLQVLSSNISTTGNIFATFISATGSIRAGNALYQNGNVVRIGSTGNSSFTEYNTTSVGARAGFSGQQEGAVALGAFAGQADQQGNAVAVGRAAGNTYQGANAVAVGFAAGLLNQGANAFAMGAFAGQVNQGANSIAIGRATGNTNQGPYAIAMGFAAGFLNQGANAFAMGWNAGNTYQGDNAIALGPFAGNVSQGSGAIAIGRNTGAYTQGANSVAIGRNTANTNQGVGAIAVGQEAGVNTQGANAIAIGYNAGNNHQGINSIAIGKLAGYGSQQNNSIILNASGNIQNGNNSGLYINPVRNDTANVSQVMFFNTGTKEVTYAPQSQITASYSNANVQSFMPVFAGSLGNLVEIYADDVYVTGNVEAGFFTGDGSNLYNLDASHLIGAYGDANVAAYLPTYNGDLNPNAISASGNVTMGSLLVAGSGTVVGDFNVLGNLTYTGINVATTSNLYINLANNQTTYANIDNAGLVVGNASSPLTQFQYKVGSNTWVTNVGISALGNVYTANLSANGNIVATGNLTINSISSAGNILGAYLSVSGNVRGGNINTVGGITATGNIIGNTLINNSTVVRLGFNAGNIASTGNVVAIGRATAQISQGDGGIAIGFQAGNNTQGGNSIAIGRNAGAGSFGAQGANSIAIGRSAGNLTQGTESIAIGHFAGNNAQGSGAVAIGFGAGYDSQPANSIIITASGNLTGTETGLYVNPVRYDVSALGNVVFFNSDTSEVTYADAGLIGGNYSNANVESYLQVLTTDVSTTGNVSANNVIAGNVFLSNGSSLAPQGAYGIQLSSNADGVSNSSIQMANDSYVAISANTNAYIQSNTGSGNDHLWTFGQDSDLLAPGNISTSGNVIAGYLYGDGSNITGISGGSYGNSNVATFLADFGSNSISTSGNITTKTGTFTNGDGAGFEIGNTQMTLYFQSGSEYPQWIVSRHNTSAPNNAIDFFTSNGNAAAAYPANAVLGLTVNNGNVGIANVPYPGNALDVGGSVYAAGNISALGNISAAYLYGDGSNITNLPAGSYSNSNVASYLQVLTSDVSTTGNVYANNVNANIVYGQGLPIQGYDFVQMQYSNATALPVSPYDIGTGAWFYVDAGGGTFESNITGTVKSVILGNDGSVNATGNISTTGNVLAGFLYGDGSNITGLPASYSNSNVESFLQVLTSDISTTGNIAAGNISITGNIYAPEIVSSNVTVYGHSIITGNLTVQGTTTTINSNVVIINDLAITLANNVSTTSALQGAGITAGNSAGDPLVSLTYDVGTDSWQSNVGVTPSANASLNLGGATNYWNNIYSTTINNSGNISAIGNVTASYIIGNGSALTSINGSNVSGTVANATYATSAGSATTATTAGTVTTNAQSNITSVGTLTSLTVNGLISTTGNISGNYILGNGSQLTGLPATYGNSNVANYLPTYSGVLTAVGNIASTGFVSATGNVNGGNILTAGVVSATGNITANYFVGNGSLLTGISAGNYSNANVTAFLPTYTGNIGNTGNSVSVQFVNYKDVVYTGGNANTTITPDASNGSVYKYTLTGNITLNAFGGTPQAGQSMTIILTQDATGNRLLTSNMKYAGGAKTLSTAANATDIIYTFFDGTNYYATLSRAYQ